MNIISISRDIEKMSSHCNIIWITAIIVFFICSIVTSIMGMTNTYKYYGVCICKEYIPCSIDRVSIIKEYMPRIGYKSDITISYTSVNGINTFIQTIYSASSFPDIVECYFERYRAIKNIETRCCIRSDVSQPLIDTDCYDIEYNRALIYYVYIPFGVTVSILLLWISYNLLKRFCMYIHRKKIIDNTISSPDKNVYNEYYTDSEYY